MAGSGASMVYADLPNRIIAYIIDIIVVVIINVVVGIILAAIGLAATSGSGLDVSTNWVGSIIFALVALAINGAYFIYSWTNRRATLGMQALGLQIGTFPGGATITMDQAVRRWLALGAIFSIAQAFN
ncbi:MAG TPA: RDD family protein, partial [Candidatus Limnocylindrales bacterium]